MKVKVIVNTADTTEIKFSLWRPQLVFWAWSGGKVFRLVSVRKIGGRQKEGGNY